MSLANQVYYQPCVTLSPISQTTPGFAWLRKDHTHPIKQRITLLQEWRIAQNEE